MTREEALNKVRQMSLPKETMEILEALVPELAESEDERIRRWLCDYFSSIDKAWIHKDITCIDILRWLEKQKEQKVSVDDFKAKDWYVSKVDGKIHNIYYSVDKVKPKFKVGDKIIEKNFDECGRGTIIDIKDGKYIFDDGGFICIEEQGLWKLVEQKPAEYIKRNSKEWYSLLAEQYDKGFWKGKAEQKPAEWSEEDEKDMAHIIRILDDCYVYGTHDLSKTDRENLVNKLKSLRPSWKPSEEQMEALHRCVDYLEESDNEDAEFMESLLEQLKKLM